MSGRNSETMVVYVGTYTQGEGEGIYVYRFHPSSGELQFVSRAAGVDNPSFLALHPQEPYLYAVNEVDEVAGKRGGAVSTFSINLETGELTFLNQQTTHGPGPCYLSLDRTGRYVLVANYTEGSVCVLPIQHDGRLGAATDFVEHHGSSIHPRRQRVPHAHCVVVDPTNRYAFVADLGLDKIMIYQLDLDRGRLEPNDEPWIQVKPGAGPRHLTFHPNGGYAYVINELDSTLTAFAYDEGRGTLREIQTVPALPEGFEGTNYCADVHVSPSGRFVYGSNRGHDSIVIFAVEESTGELSYVGHEPTEGRYPRGFAIDPAGAFLLAANRHTNTVVTFRIDQQTGRLVPTGHVVTIPTPVCVKIVPVSSQDAEAEDRSWQEW